MPVPRFSIVVVGDGAVGKSAMTLRFLRDQFHDEYDPTIEDSYCKHIEVDGMEYTLDIIDTAGQNEYRGHWNDQFLRAGDGFICVYSIASMGSFQELVGFREQIWRAKDSEDVPIVVAANKCDLEEERQVAAEIGQEFAQMSNGFYIETSAKTGFNIHEMVHELVREIVRRRQLSSAQDDFDGSGIPSNSHLQSPSLPSSESVEGAKVVAVAPMEVVDRGEEEDYEVKKRQCCCTVM